MKRLLLFAVLGLVAAGCASSNKAQSTQGAGAEQDAKYQIIDQEFDNLVVPNDHYNRVAPYEEQISGSSYIQSSTSNHKSKPQAKTTSAKTKKTVVDGQGNILPESTRAPIADEEALPDEYTGGAAY